MADRVSPEPSAEQAIGPLERYAEGTREPGECRCCGQPIWIVYHGPQANHTTEPRSLVKEGEQLTPRCHGEGEIEVGTRRDEFGNWDTETYKCPGCPDCGGLSVEDRADLELAKGEVYNIATGEQAEEHLQLYQESAAIAHAAIMRICLRRLASGENE